ncbi:glycosyltransferase family 4 protein [Hyphomonas sp.]|uniref:glycosyltransferase family 4 protein n=1 Tax=Hyphomonas sp. TaxID=87 RepID=UPI0025BA83F4|nr:glycosyltransferase family 4 protein [Hyphomonas sp.]MBI1399418.1 glycosyltransferase [Hyphomonas sp.]
MTGPDDTAPRIIFVNRYFHPDISATSQMLTDVAIGLAALGRPVRVLTSAMMYDDASIRLPARELVEGVSVRRVPTTRFGRAGLIGRSLDYLSFYLSSFMRVLQDAQKGDVIVIKTDPPLLSVPLGLAARVRGAKTVNWLQDVFPETAQALGVGLASGPIGWIARQARNRSLRRASRNVVIGECMAQKVRLFGAPQSSIRLVPNFCDDTAIQPAPAADNVLRASWGFSPSDFVIGYSGNLGRAHDLNTILGAAEALRDLDQVKFLFIGGGHLRAQLKEEAEKRSLSNIVTRPYQPRDQLGLSLCIPDVHWVSLLPALEGLILPSKLYGIAAAGRPLLMVGDPDGDIGRIVREHRFGSVVPVGAIETLSGRIRSWHASPDLLLQMGRNARAYIETHASRDRVIAQWSALLDEVLDE